MTYFEDATIEEADTFERTDMTKHRAYVTQLVSAWRTASDGKVAVGQVTVPTGEIITNGGRRGRGKEELSDEIAFRKVAKELGVGLRVTRRHLPDGRTILRLSPQEKKIFSDDAVAKRQAALDKRRDRIAIEKYAKSVNKQTAQLTEAEAKKAVADYRALAAKKKANGVTKK